MQLTRFNKFGSTSFLLRFFWRLLRGFAGFAGGRRSCQRRLFFRGLTPCSGRDRVFFRTFRRPSPMVLGRDLGCDLGCDLGRDLGSHYAYRRAQGMTTSPRSKRRAPRMFRTFSWGGPPRLTRPDSMGAGASRPRRWASRRSILADFFVDTLAGISTTLRRVGRLGDREAVYR